MSRDRSGSIIEANEIDSFAAAVNINSHIQRDLAAERVAEDIQITSGGSMESGGGGFLKQRLKFWQSIQERESQAAPVRKIGATAAPSQQTPVRKATVDAAASPSIAIGRSAPSTRPNATSNAAPPNTIPQAQTAAPSQAAPISAVKSTESTPAVQVVLKAPASAAPSADAVPASPAPSGEAKKRRYSAPQNEIVSLLGFWKTQETTAPPISDRRSLVGKQSPADSANQTPKSESPLIGAADPFTVTRGRSVIPACATTPPQSGGTLAPPLSPSGRPFARSSAGQPTPLSSLPSVPSAALPQKYATLLRLDSEKSHESDDGVSELKSVSQRMKEMLKKEADAKAAADSAAAKQGKTHKSGDSINATTGSKLTASVDAQKDSKAAAEPPATRASSASLSAAVSPQSSQTTRNSSATVAVTSPASTSSPLNAKAASITAPTPVSPSPSPSAPAASSLPSAAPASAPESRPSSTSVSSRPSQTAPEPAAISSPVHSAASPSVRSPSNSISAPAQKVETRPPEPLSPKPTLTAFQSPPVSRSASGSVSSAAILPESPASPRASVSPGPGPIPPRPAVRLHLRVSTVSTTSSTPEGVRASSGSISAASPPNSPPARALATDGRLSQAAPAGPSPASPVPIMSPKSPKSPSPAADMPSVTLDNRPTTRSTSAPSSAASPVGPLSPDAYRAQILSEIVSSEESYVTSLRTLVTEFIHPLKSSQLDFNIPQADIAAMFSNVELLFNFHQILLTELKAASIPVAEILLKYADFLKMYTQYLNNYQASLTSIDKHRRNGKFQTFLTEKRKKCGQQDISSFLIMPVQKIPRYRLLLEQLLKYTPATHSEHEKLVEALTKITHIADHVNNTKRLVENMSKLLEVQNQISGDFGTLMLPHRRLIRQGLLSKLSDGLIKSTNSRHLYLFNDLALWTSSSFKFRGYMELENAKCELFRDRKRIGFKISNSNEHHKDQAEARAQSYSTSAVTPASPTAGSPINTASSALSDSLALPLNAPQELVFLTNTEEEAMDWLKDISESIRTLTEATEQAKRNKENTQRKAIPETEAAQKRQRKMSKAAKQATLKRRNSFQGLAPVTPGQ